MVLLQLSVLLLPDNFNQDHMCKKIQLLSLLLLMLLPILSFGSSQPAIAQSLDDTLKKINESAQLPGFDKNIHPNASNQPGASNITSALLTVIDLLKYLLQGIAIVMIVASGVRLVTAGKEVESIAEKQKENIKWAIIGFIIIMIADVMVKQAFFGNTGEVFQSPESVQIAAEKGSEQLRGIYNGIEFILGAIAILMIVIAGFRLVTSGGNEDVVTKSKKQIMWAIAGLVLIGASEFVMKDIIFPNQGSQLSDIEKGREFIVTMTNFVSGFMATAAVALYMYAGVLYVTDAGKGEQTEKAKKVIIGATIGLIIAMAAFALVYTVVDFRPPSGALQPASTQQSGEISNP